MDATGLTVSGGILGFAWTNVAPLLFDSATGSLALYFRGATEQFFVTYFSTLSERAKYPLGDAAGVERVVCLARSTDFEMDKLVIAVGEGKDAAHCTVSVTGADIEETWRQVPRDPARFARVVNGEASVREFIGAGSIALVQGQARSLAVPGGIKRALDLDTTLVVGRSPVSVAAITHKGATSVQIRADDGLLPVGELPIYYLEYDYARHAQTTKVPNDLYNGSLLVRAAVTEPAAGASSGLERRWIGNQRVSSGATINSKWTAESPGSTLAFDGAGAHAHLADPQRLSGFAASSDLTLEVWVKPGAVSDLARLIEHRSDTADYTLGLQRERTPLVFDGAADHVDFGDILNPGATHFTVELWFRCDRKEGENILYNKEDLYEAAVKDGYFQYAWRPHWHWDGGDKFPITTGRWYHAALVYDGAKQTLYRNGVELYSRPQSGPIGSNTSKLLVAARGDQRPSAHFRGAIDDIRVWQRARSGVEIQRDMHLRLRGDEQDLVGYWRFQGVASSAVADFSSKGQAGELRGQPQSTTLYRPVAGIGGRVARSRDCFPIGEWAHLAATFNQSYGLEFDGKGGYLDCGRDPVLNQSRDLSIEMLVTTAGGGKTRGLLAKGRPGDGAAGQVPFALELDSNRLLVFSFEDEKGELQVFKSAIALGAVASQRLAVTRKRENRSFSLAVGEFYSVTWDDLRFYIDDRPAGHRRYADGDNLIDDAIELANYADADKMPAATKDRFRANAGARRTFQPREIGRGDAALEIGRSHESRDRPQPFAGIIGEVRVWSRALKPEELSRRLAGKEDGLVAWWRFEERKGTSAADAVGSNHGTFHGSITWVKDPDPWSSSLVLYRNGLALALDEAPDSVRILPPGWPAQLTLGAARTATGYAEHFQGELEELRIWQTIRSPEQIQDNLFRRLTGETEQLIAYYDFDATQERQLLDQSFRGNHLALEGTAYVLSTAPIGLDTPQVRSALAGLKTAFHDSVQATPGVAEYGDLQFDATGNLIGSFKRCYSLIKNGEWHLITGFKVGDLSTEWVGQVQFAPQLLGYIEGAPPVPSENLTATGYVLGEFAEYTGATSVELSKAERVHFSYAASKDHGVDLAVEFKLGAILGAKADVGLPYQTEALDIQNVIGVHGNFEQSWSWTTEATTGVGRSTTEAVSMGRSFAASSKMRTR